jgi:hypothetical protein
MFSTPTLSIGKLEINKTSPNRQKWANLAIIITKNGYIWRL